MWTKAFWVDVAERATSSAAGVLVATVGAEAFDVLTADWRAMLSLAAGAAVVSVAKALVAVRVGAQTAGLVPSRFASPSVA